MNSAPSTSLNRALKLGRRVLEIEAQAVASLAERIGEAFVQAIGMILECKGRIIVSGIGKSGHIARKFAATLASTGTPAYFVHAAEAAHGDLGMIAAEDIVIAISNSGASSELLTIVPQVKRRGARLIAMTGNADSPLALDADIHLDAAVAEEACPLNLAPTASTTAELALSDALAVALLDARGFGTEDFARSHPGGSLGRRLLTHVRDVMRSRERVPAITGDVFLIEALLAMTRGSMGMVVALEADGKPKGIFTDGDLRRALENGIDVRAERLSKVLTKNPHAIDPDALAVEAAEMMERLRISQLLVISADGSLVGALNTHDLMLARVI